MYTNGYYAGHGVEDARMVDCPAQNWYIGEHPSRVTVNASLDDVAIWTNRVLTPSEVLAVYNGGNGIYPPSLSTAPFDSPDLAVLWTFDETTGTVVSNYSQFGSSKDAAFANGTLQRVPGIVGGIGASVYSNMVLVSTNYVLPTIPTNGTVEYRIEPILATNPAVTNVDLLSYVIVDGGTNWNDVRWDYQAPLVGNESVVHGTWTVTNQYGKSNLVYRLILTNAPSKGLQEKVHAGAFSYSP
jgi:hypothetical protein